MKDTGRMIESGIKASDVFKSLIVIKEEREQVETKIKSIQEKQNKQNDCVRSRLRNLTEIVKLQERTMKFRRQLRRFLYILEQKVREAFNSLDERIDSYFRIEKNLKKDAVNRLEFDSFLTCFFPNPKFTLKNPNSAELSSIISSLKKSRRQKIDLSWKLIKSHQDNRRTLKGNHNFMLFCASEDEIDSFLRSLASIHQLKLNQQLEIRENLPTIEYSDGSIINNSELIKKLQFPLDTLLSTRFLNINGSKFIGLDETCVILPSIFCKIDDILRLNHQKDIESLLPKEKRMIRIHLDLMDQVKLCILALINESNQSPGTEIIYSSTLEILFRKKEISEKLLSVLEKYNRFIFSLQSVYIEACVLDLFTSEVILPRTKIDLFIGFQNKSQKLETKLIDEFNLSSLKSVYLSENKDIINPIIHNPAEFLKKYYPLAHLALGDGWYAVGFKGMKSKGLEQMSFDNLQKWPRKLKIIRELVSGRTKNVLKEFFQEEERILRERTIAEENRTNS